MACSLCVMTTRGSIITFQTPATISAVGIPQTPAVTNGVATITFAGIPGYTWVVETTNTLPTANWWPVSTNTAGADGLWIFTDPNATNAMQFYRSAQP